MKPVFYGTLLFIVLGLAYMITRVAAQMKRFLFENGLTLFFLTICCSPWLGSRSPG